MFRVSIKKIYKQRKNFNTLAETQTLHNKHQKLKPGKQT